MPVPMYVMPTKEVGFVDVASAVYPCDRSTGSVTLLNTVPQGATQSTRVGKKIAMKSLQCRGFFANLGSATYNDVAMLIVYDKRPTGTLPGVTDVLNSISSRAFNNDANSGRFQILKRVDFTLNGNTTTITDTTAVSADFYLNLRGKETVFKAAGTGAIADQEQGSLLLITVGSQVVAGAISATLEAGFRLRYVDI